MQLENCVYDFFELTTLNMAQKGLFGEVLHVEGSYIHNLEEFWPYYWNNWRLAVSYTHLDVYKRQELNKNANTLLIQLENNLHSLTSWEHSAQVLNLFSWQHERILC